MNKLILLVALILVAAYPAAAQGYQTATLLNAVTATGTGRAIRLSGVVPFRHTGAITVTGAPATCTLNIQWAITADTPTANDWFDLSGNQDCTSSSAGFHIADRPILWVRGNLTVLTGGTAPTVSLRYLGKGQ